MGKRAVPHQILYDLLAPLYDLGVWFLALFIGGEERLRDIVIEEVKPGGGKSILEIFAGTATLSIKAAQKGANSYALDITSGMLKAAGEKAKRDKTRLKLVRADALKLPFRESSFDAIMVSLGLHEARKDEVPRILNEAMHALKPGGRLVIFDFYKASGLTGMIQKLMFVFFEGETARDWVRTDLQGLLHKTGFRNFRRFFIASGMFQLVSAERV